MCRKDGFSRAFHVILRGLYRAVLSRASRAGSGRARFGNGAQALFVLCSRCSVAALPSISDEGLQQIAVAGMLCERRSQNGHALAFFACVMQRYTIDVGIANVVGRLFHS